MAGTQLLSVGYCDGNTAFSTPTPSLLQYLKQTPSSPQIIPSHLSKIVIADLFQRRKLDLRHRREYIEA